ncbi:MAG: hypothetical protein KDB07_10050, partial [Planctomycetes bacterium]|nr:hypothetical protein [Planctomycetota bacterium]
MKTLAGLARTMLLPMALFCAAPLLADAQADPLQESLAQDRNLRAYFSTNDAPSFEKVQAFSADLNGDGILDKVCVVWSKGRSATGLATGNAEGEFEYRGFSPLDSKEAPKVQVSDFTTEGKAEVQLVTTNDDEKRMTLVALRDNKATRTFQEFLVAYRRSEVAHYKVTKLINFVDHDRDGVREITVSERITQLVGKGKEEREIAGSSVDGSTVYVQKGQGFKVQSHNRDELSPEAQLIVASALVEAGAMLRAKATLGSLMKTTGLDDQTALAGMTLLSRVDEKVAQLDIAE